MFIIYQITNKVNKKCYIGITCNFENRIKTHLRAASGIGKSYQRYHIHHALQKYGIDNFEIRKIDETSKLAEAKALERQYIRQFDSYNNGYNLTFGGDHYIDSIWQRENQLNRIKNGTHPFAGGDMQRRVQKALWEDGKHHFIGLNEKRVENGTHNFLGDNNPIKKLAQRGIHHNKRRPWCNTKTRTNPESLKAWKIADQLFNWYESNKHKERGGGPYAMAKAFDLSCSLQSMYYDYFAKGWNPLEDEEWKHFAT